MTKIYRGDIWNEDGRAVLVSAYFLDKDDAAHYIRSPRGGQVVEIEVWEKGEYSVENEKRRKALAKLTAEERKLLGL
jgi:helix-turn-helix protein